MTLHTDHGPSRADRPPVSSLPSRGVVGMMRRFPVTSFVLLLSVVLFLKVFEYDRTHRNDRLGGLSHYGAVTNLQRVKEPELSGPFKLWDGEWWRVLVTGFHHADLFHLLGNAVFLVYLGRLLESRIGSVRLLIFLAVATPVSLIPPLLFGDAVVGLSGGIYALFGLLFVMRRDDFDLQILMPDRLVQMALLWIPIGMVLSATGVMPISNLGHVAGLAYGVLAGWVFFPPHGWWHWRFARQAFFAAHLLIFPSVDFVMHPYWNANYHWYLATQQDRDIPDRIAHLKIAVQRNSQLTGAWRLLAEYYGIQNDADKMWDALLTGMSHNRSDRKLAEQVGLYWRRSGKWGRAAALRQLRQVFGDQADEWQQHLGFHEQVAVALPNNPQWTRRFINPFEARSYLSPTFPRNVFPQPQTAPPFDPHAPDSACEGIRL